MSQDFLIAALTYNSNTLSHHGIKGQKWGVRRWQNSDGSLTPDGRIHYGYGIQRKPQSKQAIIKREVSVKRLEREIKSLNEKGYDSEEFGQLFAVCTGYNPAQWLKRERQLLQNASRFEEKTLNRKGKLTEYKALIDDIDKNGLNGKLVQDRITKKEGLFLDKMLNGEKK